MPPSAPVSVSKREIDLLEIGAWTSDTMLKEARHADSELQSLQPDNQSPVSLVATSDEKTVQETKAGQEQNVTSAKHERAIVKDSTLVPEGKTMLEEYDIDGGLSGLLLSKKLPLVQRFMTPNLESGLLACEEVLAKVLDGGNLDYLLDVVIQFSITGYESGLS